MKPHGTLFGINLYGNELEYKYLILVSTLTSILFGISVLVGIFLHDALFTIGCAAATLIFIATNGLVRKRKFLNACAWIIIINTLFMINLIWFRFEGSKGGGLVILFTLLISISILLNRTGKLLAVSCVLLNLIVLLIVENRFPHLVKPYLGELHRMADIFISFSMCGIFGVLVVQNVLQSYHVAKVKAEEANRLKSAFLENVSHEIRTPLNAIIGFSSILTKSDINRNDKLLYVGFINSACKNLMSSIDEIIDIARIESNQYIVNKNLCSIPETLNYVYRYFTDAPGRQIRKNVNFVLNPDSLQIDAYVDTDPMLLKQVLIFLLDNAIKYTHTGFIEFGCKPQQECFQFYVQDTGIGIPKKEQYQVFESFLKVGCQNGKLYRGIGLGLTISKKMITLLGGKIWFESEENRGTTFFFSLPRAA